MAKYRYSAPVWARATFEFETDHEPGTEEFEDDAMNAEHKGHGVVAGNDGTAYTHIDTEYEINFVLFDKEVSGKEIEYEKVDEKWR